jgi:hypothetical protein
MKHLIPTIIFALLLIACGDPNVDVPDNSNTADIDKGDPRPKMSNPPLRDEIIAMKGWYVRHPEILLEEYYDCSHKIKANPPPYCRAVTSARDKLYGLKQIPEDFPDRRLPSNQPTSNQPIGGLPKLR